MSENKIVDVQTVDIYGKVNALRRGVALKVPKHLQNLYINFLASICESWVQQTSEYEETIRALYYLREKIKSFNAK